MKYIFELLLSQNDVIYLMCLRLIVCKTSACVYAPLFIFNLEINNFDL